MSRFPSAWQAGLDASREERRKGRERYEKLEAAAIGIANRVFGGTMSEREEWINLIRNEYDPKPDLERASYPAFDAEWDDGAGRISDAILVDKTIFMKKQYSELTDFLKSHQQQVAELLAEIERLSAFQQTAKDYMSGSAGCGRAVIEPWQEDDTSPIPAAPVAEIAQCFADSLFSQGKIEVSWAGMSDEEHAAYIIAASTVTALRSAPIGNDAAVRERIARAICCPNGCQYNGDSEDGEKCWCDTSDFHGSGIEKKTDAVLLAFSSTKPRDDAAIAEWEREDHERRQRGA